MTATAGRAALLAGLVALAGCASPPAPESGPFAVDGIGPTGTFIYREEIEKDLRRRLAQSCPNGFDVLDLMMRRTGPQVGTPLIRYRAVVECRRSPS